MDQNLHKKAVLQLLKKMLEFGFYLEVEETKEIIQGVLIIFSGLCDVTTKDEFAWFQNPENFPKEALPNTKINSKLVLNHGKY